MRFLMRRGSSLLLLLNMIREGCNKESWIIFLWSLIWIKIFMDLENQWPSVGRPSSRNIYGCVRSHPLEAEPFRHWGAGFRSRRSVFHVYPHHFFSAPLTPSLFKMTWGLPPGSVVKNLPANAKDTGLVPDPGRPHMPWDPAPKPERRQQCPRALGLWSRTAEAAGPGAPAL